MTDGAQGLIEACRALQHDVADLERILPLQGSPQFAEIRAVIHSHDLVSFEIPLPSGGQIRLAYIQTLIERQQLWDTMVKPLAAGTIQPASFPQAQPLSTWGGLLHRLLAGCVLLLPEGAPPLAVEIGGLKQRAVTEPSTEKQVVGPKEAFVERIDTNVGLIRNRLRDPALRVEEHTVGRRSRTRVAMIYLADVTRPELVRLTRKGLRRIAIDFVRTAMDVAELIFQRGWTAFPLVEQTERPDRVATLLAEGRLALIVDGAPFTLVVPVTFWDFQHDGEGALPGPLAALFARVLRLLGIFVATALPGLYVAVLTANLTLLPVQLSLTLSASRLAVPYPVATEAILMLVLSDVLAEATTQAASAIGNALAIVGTLIIGQLMVQAHLASSLMMIVVAVSVMGAFLTLKFPLSYAPRLWKYVLVLLASVTGLIGWFTGLLLMLVHLASLESAGVPYLAPLATGFQPQAWAAVVVQATRPRIRRRPAVLRTQQRTAARPGAQR